MSATATAIATATATALGSSHSTAVKQVAGWAEAFRTCRDQVGQSVPPFSLALFALPRCCPCGSTPGNQPLLWLLGFCRSIGVARSSWAGRCHMGTLQLLVWTCDSCGRAVAASHLGFWPVFPGWGLRGLPVFAGLAWGDGWGLGLVWFGLGRVWAFLSPFSFSFCLEYLRGVEVTVRAGSALCFPQERPPLCNTHTHTLANA